MSICPSKILSVVYYLIENCFVVGYLQVFRRLVAIVLTDCLLLFKVCDDSWNRTRDLLNTTLICANDDTEAFSVAVRR